MDKASSLLQSLLPLLTGLKKYEANFTGDAKQLLQTAITTTENVQSQLATLSCAGGSGILNYLQSGSASALIKTALTSLSTTLNTLLSGGVPLPRSSKEDLGNIRLQLMGVKIEAPAEQQQLASQLTSLVEEVKGQGQDVDVVEAHLDEWMKKVLEQTHGAQHLPDDALKQEISSLEGGVQAAQSAGQADQVQALRLALNSLQRLHASQMQVDESDEEEEEEQGLEEEDEDDPFYMPMAPAAIKLAEQNLDKFALLAEPLSKEASKPFMIMMDHDGANSAESTETAGPSMQEDMPELTQADFEPRQSESGAEAAAAALAQRYGELDVTDAPGGSTTASAAASPRVASPGQRLSPRDAASVAADGETPASPSAEGPDAADAPAAAQAVSAAASPKGELPATNMPVPTGNEDKLKQFVNFLNGENPGACMFHAQMRLSFEGCRKLANFLSGSSRVRALSLSHNYLGDDGLTILCDGLRVNTSVTALDLPDNNIGNMGIVNLCQAIKHNASLTQLQLAYNRIGDEGAIAIAQLIKSNSSIKKLGMSYNNIGKAGCQALTAAINSNQSLKHLQLLPGNPVEEKDAKALAKALKRNKKFSIRAFLGIGEEQ